MRIGVSALILCLAATGAVAQRPPARPAAGFTIDVSFSPRAAAEMVRRREGLTISAYFEGEPTRAARRHASEEGTIGLGEESITVAGRPGRVVITGRGFRTARLAWIQPGTARVNVNLYSARRSGPDNILTCDLIEGPLTQIAGRTHRVRCRLITEG